MKKKFKLKKRDKLLNNDIVVKKLEVLTSNIISSYIGKDFMSTVQQLENDLREAFNKYADVVKFNGITSDMRTFEDVIAACLTLAKFVLATTAAAFDVAV